MSFFNRKNNNTSALRWCSSRGASQRLNIKDDGISYEFPHQPGLSIFMTVLLVQSFTLLSVWGGILKKVLILQNTLTNGCCSLTDSRCGLWCGVTALSTEALRTSLCPSALFGKQALVFKVRIYGFFSAWSFGLLKILRALWWIYRDVVELSCIMQMKVEQAGNVYACELSHPVLYRFLEHFFRGSRYWAISMVQWDVPVLRSTKISL